MKRIKIFLVDGFSIDIPVFEKTINGWLAENKNIEIKERKETLSYLEVKNQATNYMSLFKSFLVILYYEKKS